MFNFFKPKKTLKEEWEELQRKYKIKRSIVMYEIASPDNEKELISGTLISGIEKYSECMFAYMVRKCIDASKELIEIMKHLNEHVMNEKFTNLILDAKKSIEKAKEEVIEEEARKKWN